MTVLASTKCQTPASNTHSHKVSERHRDVVNIATHESKIVSQFLSSKKSPDKA